MNSLHQQLEILNDILEFGYSTEELCEIYNITEEVFNQHIADARNFGADLEYCTVISNRTRQPIHYWACINRYEIEDKGVFRAWLKAERDKCTAREFG